VLATSYENRPGWHQIDEQEPFSSSYLLQEESHSLQKTIGVKEEAILLEEKINLQDQLIDALQSQVSPLTRRTNWMTLIATK
jgi:cell division protein FtsL